jgi:hypothetical protein
MGAAPFAGDSHDPALSVIAPHLIAHDLFGKSASTFPDHAPGAVPKQNTKSGIALALFFRSETGAHPEPNRGRLKGE